MAMQCTHQHYQLNQHLNYIISTHLTAITSTLYFMVVYWWWEYGNEKLNVWMCLFLLPQINVKHKPTTFCKVGLSLAKSSFTRRTNQGRESARIRSMQRRLDCWLKKRYAIFPSTMIIFKEDFCSIHTSHETIKEVYEWKNNKRREHRDGKANTCNTSIHEGEKK